jgi:eukaryotic-like serine/threonine-protein kinase
MTTPIDITWLQRSFPELSDFRPLGQGGQKVVLAAKHGRDGDVVLKIVYPKTDPESVRREILAVQQIQSPRVPRVLEHGIANTNLGACVWVREERVSGTTLRSLLATAPLPAESVLRLGLHMMEALERAESSQIVHRDVKPDNIMQDLGGDYWLLDFGIARHLDLSSLTATGLPYGKMTLGYAPPEQCRNFKREIDSRADLFALGVTMHECATGKNAFLDPPPRDHLELLKRVEHLVLPPVALPINAKEGFRDLIATMTQKNRIHRPRTIKDARTWLQEICKNEGIV